MKSLGMNALRKCHCSSLLCIPRSPMNLKLDRRVFKNQLYVLICALLAVKEERCRT